jgi:enolase-phosphatase E1
MKAVLTDMLGTTTPAGFVKTLIENSHMYGADFIARHAAEPRLIAILDKVKAEAEKEGVTVRTGEEVMEHVYQQLSHRNLKPEYLALHGMVNVESYQTGNLTGEVFDDVPGSFERWRANGKGIFVYSNGSEESQAEMFRTTSHGDLRPLVDRFFDTEKIGSKYEADSYKKISDEIQAAPKDMLFLSDAVKELDAADQAGCPVYLLDRPGNKPQGEHKYSVIQTFDKIAL